MLYSYHFLSISSTFWASAKLPAFRALQGSLRQGSSEARTENCTQHGHNAQPEVVVPAEPKLKCSHHGDVAKHWKA